MRRRPSLFSVCLLLTAALLAGAGADRPLPSIPGTIVIRDWEFAGPFETGAREPAVDPLFPWGPQPPEEGYSSAFAEGGLVRWTAVRGDEQGKTEIRLSRVPWKVLTDSWGIVGTNHVTVCRARLSMEKACRAKISSKGVTRVAVNGRWVMADSYGFNRWEPTIELQSGANEVLLLLIKHGETFDFTFRMLPETDRLRIITADITCPDALEGGRMDGWIAVPLANCTAEWLRGVVIEIGGPFFAKTRTAPLSVAPHAVKKIPLQIRSRKVFPKVGKSGAAPALDLDIRVFADATGADSRARIRVPLRRRSEDRRETFLSRLDRSVQFYALKEPLAFDPGREYGMIFSLHGASVDALNQVRSYAPRDWAFVVAPTNRREYGFNWHEQGRIDALEVLDAVCAKYRIDPDRIMLTGHSMGGHGAWHVGTLYADRFAAMAPACGWMSIDLYIPQFLTKFNVFAQPGLRHVWDRGYVADRPQVALANLGNLPVMIMIAGADDDVPPAHGRLFAETLRRLGMNPEVHDIPGKPHWYDDDPKRPGVDVVDAPFFEDFYRNKVRNRYPERVRFVMTDPTVRSGMYWLEVEAVGRYLEPAEVDARWEGERRLWVQSSNVSVLRVALKEKRAGEIEVVWNGRKTAIAADERGDIRLIASGVRPRNAKGLSKDSVSGPMKKAYQKPFVIVVGTHCPEPVARRYLEAAAAQSHFWWYTANGFCDILLDREATEERLKGKNLILIGTPADNSLMKEKIGGTPVRVSGEGVDLSGQILAGAYAVKFVYPDASSPDRLILYSTGTDGNMALLSEALTPYSTYAALPDFVVFDSRVRDLGFAGVTAAGYFDREWRFDPELFWIRQ